MDDTLLSTAVTQLLHQSQPIALLNLVELVCLQLRLHAASDLLNAVKHFVSFLRAQIGILKFLLATTLNFFFDLANFDLFLQDVGEGGFAVTVLLSFDTVEYMGFDYLVSLLFIILNRIHFLRKQVFFEPVSRLHQN